MGHSQRLRLRDVRAAFRLVGEVRELGADPRAWRRHLLEQLNRLTGTQVGLASEIVSPFDGRMPPIGDIVELGWLGEAERRLGVEYIESGLNDDPAIPGIFGLQAEGRRFTRTRRHFVDDGPWYASSHVNEFRRPIRVDDFLVSHRVVPHLGVANVLVLARAWGERPIDASQRRLVHLCHAELGRLWESVPAGDVAMADLPPRLRQVLAGLRTGDAEKRVAARLGLSRHTVHNYVKALHRRFEASSRGELLARSAPRFADFRPRLSRELE